MSRRHFLLALFLLPLGAAAQVTGASILLVAGNGMSDPRFARSVVLVTRHGMSPPVGVIINRPTEASLGKLFPALPEDEGKRLLHFGGPVATGHITFLFRGPEGSRDAITVAPGIHLGRSAVTLRRLLHHELAHNGLKVFAGYAGWADGQLETEIQRGDWYVLPIDQQFVFDVPPEKIWPELFRRASITSAAASRPVCPDFFNPA